VRPRRRSRAVLPALLCLLLNPLAASSGGEAPAAAAGLTPAEQAGRQIYQRGTSPSGGEIVAVLAGGTQLPASALPCSGCHGEDGRGNPEGGVRPTDLSWEILTRPYGVRGRGGREHGPYTESRLARAVALGLDPAGNELHVAMPRYRMSLEEMDALVAYLRQLGRGRRDWDPGIGPDRLRVGTLLPPAGRMGEVGGVIEGVLRAWAAELAEGGDLYGRRIELVPFTLPDDPARWSDAVGGYLAEQDVFALVGAYVAGAEAELAALLRERSVPLIGAFTLRPEIERPVNPQVFYLLSGLEAQGRAMVDLAFERSRDPAADGGGAPPVATVLHPRDDPGLAKIAAALVEEGRRLGWDRLQAQTYDAGGLDALGIAAALATAGSRVVFFLGSGADRQLLLRGADQFHWRPDVYTAGAMAGPEALDTPSSFDGHLYLSVPTLPDDRTPQAVASHRTLAAKHGLPADHLTTQLTTLAAARLFEEGVKRAGRDLSRARLVAQLEQLYKWDSGLTPLLTFEPNRRIGARGAYVVVLDLQARTFRRTGGWIAVE
jgi:ABC-type branched-subunit amino acid transport system substrate-binding protein